MLILQHIWARWTKRTRGAQAADRRPRFPEAYPLPTPWPRSALHPQAWLHEIRSLEAEQFQLVARIEPLEPASWADPKPWHPANLHWRITDAGVQLSLLPPAPMFRQTAWPILPQPLMTLAPGETLRIDWNARFRKSATGSNRASFFDEHRFWLGCTDTPRPDLFTQALPEKHIDLRINIY
jgi:hypothetical protein